MARLLALLLLTTPLLAESAPVDIRYLGSPPVIDGDLSDAVWQDAGRFDSFIETSPAKNTPAAIRTLAFLGYDDSALYIAFRCDDPRVSILRAPFVQRDAVLGTDDNLAVFIDTRGDRRSAYEFRVNPRGIQADAVYNDLTGTEDFAHDFAYDSAARIDSGGWTAELRIPFSSLRYSEASVPRWNILLSRNYPRDFRYFLRSAPSGGSACLICHANELRGLGELPAPRKILATPYATANHLEERGFSGDAGADVKWTPSPDLVLDLTLNPDFSQIELDVPQLTVNERFALSLAENRRFFMESSDLFETPVRAAYTRSITDPLWGMRASGQIGTSTYTLLAARDEGGGSAIIPGPFSSRNVLQDFHSTAMIGRAVRPFGRARTGVLFTSRQISGGGHNRVFGPDWTWRPASTDFLSAQLLISSSETPERTDLAAQWNGSRSSGHAAFASWQHYTPTIDWYVEGSQSSNGFRADNGFVPRVGVEEGRFSIGYKTQPASGYLRLIRPYLAVRRAWTVDERDDVGGGASANLLLRGWKNLTADASYGYEDVVLSGRSFRQWQFRETATIDISRRWPRVQLDARLGDVVDVANARPGTGGTVAVSATFRANQRSDVTALVQRQWLDVEQGRLFTAQVQRLKAVYNVDSRRTLRLVVQHTRTDRARSLYLATVAARSAAINASFLFSYRLNWQTVVHAGYGDDERLSELNGWIPESRGAFFKISYLVQ